MIGKDYENWLQAQKYSPGTVTAQLHRIGRVEAFYGDLQNLFRSDGFGALIEELTYSVADERSNRPNPSKIDFRGDNRKNLASYKDAVVRYQRFLTGSNLSTTQNEDGFIGPEPSQEVPRESGRVLGNMDQRLSLERDMQAALRRDIRKLSGTLNIIDDGAERSVDSGFIDITCEDSSDNSTVIIELKAGKADSRAIGQILGYMGDIAAEEECKVKGILIANEFDKRTISAARAVPNLRLVCYSVEFSFKDHD